MKLDKNYKVRVTPEQSRQIQEAVEPKFKAGDKVYIPNIKNLCTIRDDGKVITSNGQYYCDLSDSYDLCFVLATPENHALLSKLYPHIEFEQPAKELKGSDLARALIKKGWVGFNCLCGHSGDENAITDTIVIGINNDGKFTTIDGRLFSNAIPMKGRLPLKAQEVGL